MFLLTNTLYKNYISNVPCDQYIIQELHTYCKNYISIVPCDQHIIQEIHKYSLLWPNTLYKKHISIVE